MFSISSRMSERINLSDLQYKNININICNYHKHLLFKYVESQMRFLLSLIIIVLVYQQATFLLCYLNILHCFCIFVQLQNNINWIWHKETYSNPISVTNQCNMQVNKHALNCFSIQDLFLSARDRDLANKP